jgi:uncharacterized membrane protein
VRKLAISSLTLVFFFRVIIATLVMHDGSVGVFARCNQVIVDERVFFFLWFTLNVFGIFSIFSSSTLTVVFNHTADKVQIAQPLFRTDSGRRRGQPLALVGVCLHATIQDSSFKVTLSLA